MKFIGNMPQGEKQMKSTKVNKEVLKKNQGKITDLMQQVGEDDDSSEDKNDNGMNNLRNKNKVNIDYNMMDDYQAAYDSKKETKNNLVDNSDI